MGLLTYSLFVPTDHLTKADLRRLCRKWGLPVSRKSTKMEMLHAYIVWEEERWAEREAEKKQMTKYPSDEEGDYSNEEDDYSDEERDPVRAEWLRARERWVEELDEFLERAEAASLLALEEEKIAAQELSCKELKLEAGRAESSSDGGS
ncbi:hypothetical protein NDU88_004363 [Pleurodeles waltl]|uniref:SAP domain-containing protein n=1 Tax=Pleurodeles waltl TaxID=8319 RepID=A0AAV7QCS7_PLEWA|nr:hypothetical protein NDU88_004363 [Pleurodeles waltl]